MPIRDWNEAISHFLIKFEHRTSDMIFAFTHLYGQTRVKRYKGLTSSTY